MMRPAGSGRIASCDLVAAGLDHASVGCPAAGDPVASSGQVTATWNCCWSEPFASAVVTVMNITRSSDRSLLLTPAPLTCGVTAMLIRLSRLTPERPATGGSIAPTLAALSASWLTGRAGQIPNGPSL